MQNGDSSAFAQLQDVGRLIHSADYQARMKDIAGFAKDVAFNNDSLLQWIKGLTQAAQAVGGAAAGQAAGAAGEKPAATPAPKESFTFNGKKLSEGQIYMIFNRVCAQQQLNEGPMDFIKGAAAKGMDKLKTAGKNLTTKFTADKLNSVWQKAGSPTDSEEVAKILSAAGVGDDVVKQVYTDLKISAEPAAQAATGGYAEVKKAIAQLNTKDRKRMIAYLTKQLGTA
jgi:ribosomal protein L12E/L44/L45/RPP1/RPP2